MFIRLKVFANNHLDLFAVNGQRIIEQCDCRFQPRSEEAVDVVLLDRERYVAWQLTGASPARIRTLANHLASITSVHTPLLSS